MAMAGNKSAVTVPPEDASIILDELYEIRSIGAEFRILSPQKSMPSWDFCGGCFCGSRSDLAETELWDRPALAKPRDGGRRVGER
jgi:hypothetical protein